MLTTNTAKLAAEQYARRQLHDVANILERLSDERWDNLGEREAILSALKTHSPVLRAIAEHIKLAGFGDE